MVDSEPFALLETYTGKSSVFSPMALSHINNPRNVGQLEGATHYGVAGVPGDGPFVQMWFIVNGDQIERGTYKTYGCPTSIASASMIAELVAGKSVATALSLTEADIRALLAYVPEGKGDCPPRAIQALQNALEKL